MNNPIVIVDPRSSGIELAPAFKARGIPTIALTFKPIKERIGFGTEVDTSDFSEVISVQDNIAEILSKYNPLGFIPGAEKGVPLANELADKLTPNFANDSKKLLNRLHKAHMQEALHNAGISSLKTLDTSSEKEVDSWLKNNELENSPLIIKPPISAGSEKVYHISENGNWKGVFNEILSEPSNITGQLNESVIIQELAIGPEFSIGTVSANGKHYLAHLIKYNKIEFNGRETIYDHVEFVPFDEEVYGELFDYTKTVLDALGVFWGASHNEVMLTKNGPRLIESVPRMTGGPVVGFAREATGSSQADKLVEAYIDGDITNKNYKLKKTVVPVFLRSSTGGIVTNAEVFNDVTKLSTLFQSHIWFKNGDSVPQTIDYLTSIGIVALSGDRKAVFEDYKKIREMESNLIISRS
ncbi:ATP-grasp domain-containing protein [Candidatus Uabimicrobium sp. HlEnr_7]|uniref:ATP-grasp domain-containing protein n=1 Tax=Candidatus Uabimicrobium helgolandensis TaxID=3095367 RepID=UPI003556E69F